MKDKDLVDSKNCDKSYPATNALFYGGDETRYTLTDCDHQLIITVAFTQPVKVKDILIVAKPSEQAPKFIRLFKNKPHMGFDDCESDPATEEFEVRKGDLGEKKKVKFVKWQSVTNLTFFVQDNCGADTTRLDGLEFFGYPI